MAKFYTYRNHYPGASSRGYLSHFLRPFFKDKPVSKDELLATYGDYVNFYESVNTVSECDFAILPMAIEYYMLNNKRDLMLSFIDAAKKAGKKVITETHGDFGVTPLVKDVIVMRQNGYQNRRLLFQYAMPAFFGDPMKRYFQQDTIVIREKLAKPVIGFCGQASTTWKKNLYDVCRTAVRNLKYHVGLSVWEPHSLYPSTLLRSRTLKMIEKDDRLEANFIKRDKYRAGANSKDDREKTTREFYQNMIDSDYIVCVRGGGNFSVRIYETLAMGRIPIFINTDCILPFDNIIDWKRYCVWVEAHELHRLGDIVSGFHEALSPEEFKQRQQECRALWEKHLSSNGAMMSLMSLV